MNKWIVRFRPYPAATIRLFCFPFAGGGASAYRLWANDLPSHIELCAVQLPGRESRLREAALYHMTDLVDALATGIQRELDRPFAFFGHSLGSLVAFETIRELRRRWQPQPLHLFASGRQGPQLPDTDSHLHTLPDAQFMPAVQRRYDGIPAAVMQSAELMELVRPVLRADMTIVETYTYQDALPLDVPITVFGGLQDRTSRSDLDAWGLQTSADFRLQMFPGKHFFIQPRRAQVIRTIVRSLVSQPVRQPAYAD